MHKGKAAERIEQMKPLEAWQLLSDGYRLLEHFFRLAKDAAGHQCSTILAVSGRELAVELAVLNKHGLAKGNILFAMVQSRFCFVHLQAYGGSSAVESSPDEGQILKRYLGDLESSFDIFKTFPGVRPLKVVPFIREELSVQT